MKTITLNFIAALTILLAPLTMADTPAVTQPSDLVSCGNSVDCQRRCKQSIYFPPEKPNGGFFVCELQEPVGNPGKWAAGHCTGTTGSIQEFCRLIGGTSCGDGCLFRQTDSKVRNYTHVCVQNFGGKGGIDQEDVDYFTAYKAAGCTPCKAANGDEYPCD